jgi:hypothetical protein
MPKKEYHSGIVRDNQDEQKRGRLLIECPDIAYGQTMPWADPKMHFVDSSKQAGSFWIPNIGSIIEVEIESEEDSEATTLLPKWRCDVYPDGTVPEVFQENYPERRGWVTAAGHIMYFDDTDGELMFKLIHPSGTEVVITNDGEIQLTPASGQSVLIGGGADQSLVRGQKLTEFFGSIITPGTFLGWAASHTHGGVTTGGGTSGMPSSMPGNLPSDLLSDDHKVK